MPDTLLPPEDLASIPSYIQWTIGVLVFVVGFLYWQGHAARKELADELRGQKAEGERMLTAILDSNRSVDGLTKVVGDLVEEVRRGRP